MRLIDAQSLEKKIRPVLRLAENKGDGRASAALRYVLDLMEDEPTLTLRAEKSAKKEVKRHKYGEYGNVLLSDAEYEKLKGEFPDDYCARIEALSAYIEAKGEKYKSHLAVIRNWARREKEEKKDRENPGSFDTEEFFRAALARSTGERNGTGG